MAGEYDSRYARLVGTSAEVILRIYNDHRRMNGRNGDFAKNDWDRNNYQPLLDLISATQEFQKSNGQWRSFDWHTIASRFPETLGDMVNRCRRGIRACQDKWNEIARSTGIMQRAFINIRHRSRSRERLLVDTPERGRAPLQHARNASFVDVSPIRARTVLQGQIVQPLRDSDWE